MNHMIRGALLASCAIVPAAVMPVTSAYAQSASRNYSIAPQAMNDALRQYANQSGQDVVFDPALVAGLKSKGLQGSYDAETALKAVVRGTKLEVYKTSSGFALRGNGSVAITASDGDVAASSGEGVEVSAQSDSSGISEILVVGSRSQNVDIKRSESGIQPYVVFGAKELESSGARDVDEFLRTRLTMSAQRLSTNQQEAYVGPEGGVDLRGLGTDQTLILIDGRRAPAVSNRLGSFGQPYIAGLPVSQIERIEVLPATAGGIYGGGATGGVINIIRKRDYKGVEVQFDYGNTSDFHAPNLSLSVAGSVSPNRGKTQINFSASIRSDKPLFSGDRKNFTINSRNLAAENNPLFYSSPPTSTTPNICKQSATNASACASSGASLTFDAGIPGVGGQPLGSLFTSLPEGIGANTSIGELATGLQNNAGGYNINPPAKYTLTSDSSSYLLGLNVRHGLSSKLDLFVDLQEDITKQKAPLDQVFSIALQADDQFNPFQENILVTVPISMGGGKRDIKTFNGSAGLIFRPLKTWSVLAEYSHERTKNKFTDFVPLGTFTNPSISQSTVFLNYLRSIALADPATFDLDEGKIDGKTSTFGPFRSITNLFRLQGSGVLIRIGDREVAATVAGEWNKTTRSDGYQTISPTKILGTGGSLTFFPAKSRTVGSLYGELRAPIVMPDDHRPLLNSLEVMASVRYDKYKNHFPDAPAITLPDPNLDYSNAKFDTVNYTIGGKWALFPGLTLRGTYATGFLPPRINQLYTEMGFRLGFLARGLRDPLRGNEVLLTSTPILSGGNPDLMPEKSKSLSLGIILEPPVAPGLRVSLDYTRTEKSDEAITAFNASNLQFIINNADAFPGRVGRSAPANGDPYPVGPINFLDTTYFNIASTLVEAIDIQADYGFNVGVVHFAPYAVATYQPTLRRKLLPTADGINLVGHSDGPLKWRFNAGVNITAGRAEIGWNTQYYDGYSLCQAANPSTCAFLTLNQGEEHIRHQMYHDLTLSYRFDASATSMLRDLQVVIGIQNIFNSSPPIIAALATSGPYGAGSYADPRLRRFNLSLRKAFH